MAHHENKGAAIVIVLAFLVMITFVVTAFFSRATANRQIENSSVGGKKAALLARSAGDLIVADLRKEMINASTSGTSPNGAYTWLTPTSGTSMMPMRILNSSIHVTDVNFLNLVKQSGIASAGTLIAAGTEPTTRPSLDGHKISGDRWSAPKLTGGTTGPVNFSDDQVPNWTLMTRSGVPVSQAWNTSFKSALTSNSNYVIGRFAFNVYDEGGLLDVNVAGYPTSVVSGSDVSLKGSQGLVNLGLIPGVPDPDTFVKAWRNLVTGKNATDYLAYLGIGGTNNQFFGAGPKYGFLKSGTSASASDNRLLSRQDLIRLATNGTLGITGTALPFLTTFSRSLNAPSYTPDPNRPKVQSQSPALVTYQTDDNFNPGLIGASARVTQPFAKPRPDGTAAVVGEPLIKHRFPLSRLSLLSPTAIATKGPDDPVNNTIYYYFGLSRGAASDPWVYNHGVLGRIFRLDEVSAQGREPDFFELLQAGISVGSLGKGWTAMDTNTYIQVLQIGVNLIDQTGTGSYPTRIRFYNDASTYADLSGIKNMPYIDRIFAKYYIRPSLSGSNYGDIGVWYQAEVWNPHQNASTKPMQLRFVGQGQSWNIYNYLVSGTPASPTNYQAKTTPPSPIANLTIPGATGGVQFQTPSTLGTNPAFATPTLLSPDVGATASGSNSINDGPQTFHCPTGTIVTGTNHFVGLYTSTMPVILDFRYIYSDVSSWDGGGWGTGGGSYGDVSFYLQYLNASGTWVTYDSMLNVATSGGDYYGTTIATPGNDISTMDYWENMDIRSRRFGSYYNYRSDITPDNSAMDAPGFTMRYDCLKGGGRGFPPVASANGNNDYPGFYPTVNQSNAYWWYGFAQYGFLTENSNTHSTYYADPDGVVRPGDAAYASGGVNGQSMQMPTPTNTSRPIILGRPFRSVAEMGYASRDMPWKTLDFFTDKSADAALLDLFCMNEQSGSALTAGVLNLNTRQQPVLKAVLSGALKDQIILSSTLSATPDADSIASSIVQTTGITPMLNRGELATKISPAIPATSFSSATDAAIKGHRESAVRALVDAGDTRTWNLLIDVVAQSGRFPVTANAADQFVVEGECRYWLHVAIDRYTGQVIDENLEVVNE